MNQRITRRPIATEDDRYGGYKKELFSTSGDVAYVANKNSGYYSIELDDSYGRARSEFASTVDVVEPNDSYLEVQRRPYRQQLFNGTIASGSPIKKAKTVDLSFPGFEAPAGYGLEYSKAPAIDLNTHEASIQEIKGYTPVLPKKIPSSRLMPSIVATKTREEAGEKKERVIQKSKLKSSDRNMLAIYIAIIVAVAIAIIATGIGIGVSRRNTMTLEDQLITQRQMLAEQEIELFRLQDSEYLAFRASQQGFTTITSYTQVPLIELRPPTSFEAPSNWFDRFSRGISSMFR